MRCPLLCMVSDHKQGVHITSGMCAAHRSPLKAAWPCGRGHPGPGAGAAAGTHEHDRQGEQWGGGERSMSTTACPVRARPRACVGVGVCGWVMLEGGAPAVILRLEFNRCGYTCQGPSAGSLHVWHALQCRPPAWRSGQGRFQAYACYAGIGMVNTLTGRQGLSCTPQHILHASHVHHAPQTHAQPSCARHPWRVGLQAVLGVLYLQKRRYAKALDCFAVVAQQHAASAAAANNAALAAYLATTADYDDSSAATRAASVLAQRQRSAALASASMRRPQLGRSGTMRGGSGGGADADRPGAL